MRGRINKRTLCGGAGSLALATALVFATGTVAGASGGLTQVHPLSLNISDRLVNDHTAHRVIALSGEAALPLSLIFVNESTYEESAPVRFPGYVNQGFAAGKPSVFAFDENKRALYAVAYHSLQERVAVANPLLVTIDVDRLTISEQKISGLFPPGFRVLGMTLEQNGLLLLTAQIQPEGVFASVPRTAGAMIVEVDPARDEPGSVSPLITFGPQPIRGCQGLIANQSQNIVAVRNQTLFISCATSSVSAATMPGVPGIIAMPRSSPANVGVSFLPGSYTLGDVFFDPNAQRLLLVGSAPSRPAQAVWVFDLAHQVFLGQIAAGDLNVYSAGVNATTGRVYVGISAQSGDGALLVSSDRGIEIPQALSFTARPIVGVISPIEASNAVIAPVQPPQGLPFYAVFSDSIPATQIQPVLPIDYAAFDRTRADQPQFSGDAQAFGLRVHEIGGVNGAGQNVLAQHDVEYWNQTGGRAGLRDGDRDLTFASTQTAHLSQGDASAAGSELQADENSDHDSSQLQGKSFSAPPAHCDDFGSTPSSSTASTATVTCSQTAGDVSTSIVSSRVAAAVVTVASSASSSHLVKDGNGVITVSHAEARGVDLNGVVRIGYLASDASSRATGISGNANAAYSRSFQNVTAGSFSCTTQCDVASVLHAISDALGSQFRVELPGAEAFETPRGAHAHAMRDPWEHQQDVVINNEQVTQTQVPALRIIYVADNASASRVMIEFAASDASATAAPLFAPCSCQKPQPTSTPAPRINAVRGDKIVAAPKRSQQAAPSTVSSVLAKIERIAGHGWNLLFPKSAGGFARAILVWALLLAPVVLAVRRRELGALRRLKP